MDRIAVFRADALPQIGAGHVMRCLTLADALAARGWRCSFLCRPGAAQVVPALARYPLTEAEDADDPARLAPADLLVVDHYRLDAAYESACRPHVGRILVLDDLADRPHACDLLMDQTLGRAAGDYAPLVPPHCRVLAGSVYALLRRDFPRLRAASLGRPREQLRRLAVSLGGTDPDNVTMRILAALHGLGLEVEVVMGGAAPHLEAVRQAVAALPGARLHVNVADMAGLLAGVDAVIGAAGTSAWERCCLGIPTIVVILADNQRLIARNLAQAGAALVVEPDGVAAALTALRRPGTLARLSAAAAEVCDGEGAERVCDAIANLFPEDRE